MSGSVILGSPLFLLLYGLALAVNLFGLAKKAGFLCLILSAVLVIGTSAWALLLGAGLYEIVTVFLIFLLINLKKIRGTEA